MGTIEENGTRVEVRSPFRGSRKCDHRAHRDIFTVQERCQQAEQDGVEYCANPTYDPEPLWADQCWISGNYRCCHYQVRQAIVDWINYRKNKLRGGWDAESFKQGMKVVNLARLHHRKCGYSNFSFQQIRNSLLRDEQLGEAEGEKDAYFGFGW